MKLLRKIGIVVVSLVIIAAISVAFISSDKAENAAMVGLCSDLTRDMMKSPSSYILGETVTMTRDADARETELKLTETGMNHIKKYIEDGTVKYKISDVYIDYEVKNAFGTLLKNKAYCRYDVISSGSNNSYNMTKLKVSNEEVMGSSLGIMLSAKDSKIGKSGYVEKIHYIKLWLQGKIM